MARRTHRLVGIVAVATFGATLLAAALGAEAHMRAASLDGSRLNPPSHAAPGFFSALERAPLAPPLRLSGSFGEYRGGHFHAGLDLSTDERVGWPVYAPLPGRIVRVRASGVGYGRSIYLKADDGRLIVLGHLDWFAEPFASYLAGVQDSTGQYDQDLWPDSTRFPVRAGQRLGWSGRSGTGPPHLHFEIRRGDMALNPLLAGVSLGDSLVPLIQRLTFEPLDEASRVEGGAAPYTLELAGRKAGGRVEAYGRLRVIVEAVDARANGRLTMAPWSTAIDWGDGHVECRFDSVSWADGMPEVDFVYDRGRATEQGRTSVMLWAPPGFRPRVLHATAPISEEAGTITVRPGDPERTLNVWARNIHGGEVACTVVLEAPLEIPHEQAVSPLERAQKSEPRGSWGARPDWQQLGIGSYVAGSRPPAWLSIPKEVRLTSLPARCLRVELVGERWRKLSPRRFFLASEHQLTRSRGRLAAVVKLPRLPLEEPLIVAGGDSTEWLKTPPLHLSAAANGTADGIPGFRWEIPRDGLFEPAVFVAETYPHLVGTGELVPVGPVYALHPDDHPLRTPLTVRLDSPAKRLPDRMGLYRDSGDGWEFVRAGYDSAARRFEGESRRLGRFALFRDLKPPHITKLSPPRQASEAPYSRWALEASLRDGGSGVDARTSYFEIDGRRVPSEWDDDKNTLRWRPLHPPARGRHAFHVIAADRAGNIARSSGTFVLD